MTSATQPSEVLRKEHRIIERVLKVLRHLVDRAESGDRFEQEAFQQCVEFFRLFADACHHAKEENLYFPALESRGIPREGGPIGVMLYEHGVARELTRQMGEALDSLERDEPAAKDAFYTAAHNYIQLLNQHIFKEDKILFAMGERVLDDGARQTLCSQFGEIGCRAFGGKTIDQLEAIATDLESRFPS